MAAASSTKQLAEELRYYARSDKHLRHFQTWLSAAAPAHPVSVIDPTATAVEAVDGEDARAKSVMQTQFFPLLKTNTLGGIVLFSPALPSTQTLLHDTLRPSPPAGVLCYTEHQLQGKGRGSNVWFSPEGCLTFSYSSSLVDGNTLPFVQYLASLAIIRAVEAVNPKSSNKVSPVRIKWPNDIYVDTVKIGGMICQSEYRDGKFSVTTGIGINISNKAPTICLQDVLSTEAVPCTVTKEEFLAAFCNAYEPMEEIFQQQGFEPFMTEYLEKWLHTNQVVQVSSDAVGVAPGTTAPAVIKGLTSTGCLLAESEGNRFELYPDGNSFDFLSGLLKRKL